MKTAIITGASSGMGKWFAIYAPTYFKEIEEVWLIGRNLKRLVRVASNIKVSTKILCLDLCNEDDVLEFKKTLETEKPEIKLLVNSAGMGVIGPFADVPEKEQIDMININCVALTRMVYDCIPYMIKDSRIINLASAAAFIYQPEFAVYAATKSYVHSFSEAIQRELKHKKIFVTSVCPGCVDTPFFRNAEKYNKIKYYKKFFMSKERCVVSLALWDSKKKRAHSIYGLSMNLLYLICKILPKRLIVLFI